MGDPKQLFKQFDKDGDGKLSEDEFLAGMKSLESNPRPSRGPQEGERASRPKTPPEE